MSDEETGFNDSDTGTSSDSELPDPSDLGDDSVTEPLLTITDTKEIFPYLTKFEYTRARGVRATQINRSAPTTLTKEEVGDMINSMDIAQKEIKMRKCPLIIKRSFPDGTSQFIKLSDLKFNKNYCDI